jgi:hypothetical protein
VELVGDDMDVHPFKTAHLNWDNNEKTTFDALCKFRISRARNCQYVIGLAEDEAPFFTLYLTDTGEVIMHVCRGPKEVGYPVMGPTRKTCYVESTHELYSCFGTLKAGYKATFFVQNT